MTDAALVSLAVSLISAFIAIRVAFSNQKAQIELERLKTELAQQSKERDARRDYEYEARKRLYEEFEPLLFKLVEECDEAWYRILSLARTARQGNLAPAKGWLAHRDGYYLVSTLYKLVAPMAVIRLLKEKLTLVDLALETHMRDQYYLAKALDRSFTDDYALAAREPALAYDKRRHSQGLPLGLVDMAAEAMITRVKDEPPRLMTFGQFDSEYRATGNKVARAFEPFADLFVDFHPETRPVLWRILVAQAVMLRTLARIRGRAREDFDPLRELTADEAALLKWTPDANLAEPLAVAHEHIRETYNQIAGV